MQINWPIILLATIVPMIIGFIWYHPKIFGTIWMRESGIDEEKIKGANMVRIFTLSFIFSFLIAFSLQFIVIHQFHVYSIFANESGITDPNSEISIYFKNFMDNHGRNFRTFGHGMFHGFSTSVILIFPIIAINSLFERKSFKYIFINAGYWMLSLMIMGGILCAFV